MKRIKLKAQVTIEFVSFVVFSFMILVVFSTVVSERYINVEKEKEYNELKDVIGMIQSEIDIASIVSEGYKRTFEIPEKVANQNYTINVIDSYLTGKTDNFESIARIPQIHGSLVKGDNIIEKKNEGIYLNS